jgi:hypothetical protein
MSANKKLDTILSLLEMCESNLKSAKALLSQYLVPETSYKNPSFNPAPAQEEGSEVMDGYFDGENMVGDNGQIYAIPQNYASKSQLVVGDRMKWTLVKDPIGNGYKEMYKLTQPVLREKVIGRFIIDGNTYAVIVDNYTTPIKILKASATFAMKNMGLQIGGEVAMYIPKTGNPAWGAFISVVNPNNPAMTGMPRAVEPKQDGRRIIYSDSASSDDFDLDKNFF